MKLQHHGAALALCILIPSLALPVTAQMPSSGPSATRTSVESSSAPDFAEAPANGLPNDPGYLLQQTAAAASDTSGMIQGVVTDAHGGLVPKASVTLEQKGRSQLRETTTDGSGHFAFANVAPGTYTVLISAPELKTFLSPPIALLAGQHYELPETALAVVANSSVTVSANSTEVAEEELHRETQQRVLGIVPNFYTSFVYDAAPLNAKQKFKLTFRALADPTAFLGSAIVAGIEQERDTFPSWGNSDAASYGKRFAASYGDEVLSRTFSYAIYASIFRQDPRYFYMGPTNKTSTRFWHAALAGVIVRGDNGKTQLNYSHLLGSASAGAVSSVYHPASDSAGYLAGIDLGIGIAGHGVQALVREFVWPRFTTHVPKYANGKSEPSATTKP
jgi:hypothetical protein